MTVPVETNLLLQSAELTELREANDAIIARYAAQKVVFDFPPVRMEFVLEALGLGQDTQARLEMELAWQRWVAEQLEATESEVRKQRLMAGVGSL